MPPPEISEGTDSYRVARAAWAMPIVPGAPLLPAGPEPVLGRAVIGARLPPRVTEVACGAATGRFGPPAPDGAAATEGACEMAGPGIAASEEPAVAALAIRGTGAFEATDGRSLPVARG